MAGVGADQDQVSSPVESSAKSQNYPVGSLGDQQPACDLCHEVPGTTIRDTSPCASMWDYPGVSREKAKGKQVWDKDTTLEQHSRQPESKLEQINLCRFSTIIN